MEGCVPEKFMTGAFTTGFTHLLATTKANWWSAWISICQLQVFIMTCSSLRAMVWKLRGMEALEDVSFGSFEKKSKTMRFGWSFLKLNHPKKTSKLCWCNVDLAKLRKIQDLHMSGVKHVEIAEDLTFVKFKCISIVLMFQHGCLISGSLIFEYKTIFTLRFSNQIAKCVWTTTATTTNNNNNKKKKKNKKNNNKNKNKNNKKKTKKTRNDNKKKTNNHCININNNKQQTTTNAAKNNQTIIFFILPPFPRNYMVLIDGAMSFSPKEAIQGKQLWTFDQAAGETGNGPFPFLRGRQVEGP